jgi:hypothetical protein
MVSSQFSTHVCDTEPSGPCLLYPYPSALAWAQRRGVQNGVIESSSQSGRCGEAQLQSVSCACSRHLEFGFRGKTLPPPDCKCFGIFVCNLQDRMSISSREIATRPFWMSPVRTRHVTPSSERIVQAHSSLRLMNNDAARNQPRGIGIGISSRIERPLRNGHVTSRIHECAYSWFVTA